MLSYTAELIMERTKQTMFLALEWITHLPTQSSLFLPYREKKELERKKGSGHYLLMGA
jgi:hypothetical protein